MIAIVDCNSFYCSCERLFVPKLRNRPVVVLSNNDGCVIARSDEAKKLGIAMGVPYFEARSIIHQHNIAVFSSNYNLYGDLSWRVMETLRQFAGEEQVEVYSVDEAFVDLSHVDPEQLERTAREMRVRVEKWTGIPVSVGVAPTKTLAKLANRLAKKDKIQSGCVMALHTDEERIQALKQTRLEDVWGVGRAYARKLNAKGYTSAWELAHLPDAWVHREMGGVVGLRLVRELRGEPCIEFKEELVQKQMIATTRMFGVPVTELSDIREAVASYATRAAEKLRRQFSAADTVQVFLIRKQTEEEIGWRGEASSNYTRLPVATSDTLLLIRTAVQLAEQLYRRGSVYKKAGVLLGGIVPADACQGDLFAGPAPDHRKLMDMIDNINFSQRDELLVFGACGTKRHWQMKQEHRSRKYTTRWGEMLRVEG
ncbi:MAG: Y-family DNA polymerase [Bacteroidota bacterium]|jgi:DNA polymerase V